MAEEFLGSFLPMTGDVPEIEPPQQPGIAGTSAAPKYSQHEFICSVPLKKEDDGTFDSTVLLSQELPTLKQETVDNIMMKENLKKLSAVPIQSGLPPSKPEEAVSSTLLVTEMGKVQNPIKNHDLSLQEKEVAAKLTSHWINPHEVDNNSYNISKQVRFHKADQTLQYKDNQVPGKRGLVNRKEDSELLLQQAPADMLGHEKLVLDARRQREVLSHTDLPQTKDIDKSINTENIKLRKLDKSVVERQSCGDLRIPTPLNSEIDRPLGISTQAVADAFVGSSLGTTSLGDRDSHEGYVKDNPQVQIKLREAWGDLSMNSKDAREEEDVVRKGQNYKIHLGEGHSVKEHDVLGASNREDVQQYRQDDISVARVYNEKNQDTYITGSRDETEDVLKPYIGSRRVELQQEQTTDFLSPTGTSEHLLMSNTPKTIRIATYKNQDKNISVLPRNNLSTSDQRGGAFARTFARGTLNASLTDEQISAEDTGGTRKNLGNFAANYKSGTGTMINPTGKKFESAKIFHDHPHASQNNMISIRPYISQSIGEDRAMRLPQNKPGSLSTRRPNPRRNRNGILHVARPKNGIKLKSRHQDITAASRSSIVKNNLMAQNVHQERGQKELESTSTSETQAYMRSQMSRTMTDPRMAQSIQQALVTHKDSESSNDMARQTSQLNVGPGLRRHMGPTPTPSYSKRSKLNSAEREPLNSSVASASRMKQPMEISDYNIEVSDNKARTERAPITTGKRTLRF